MARIDRLNYRDIGVIKAPLCWGPFYEGVEETRDLTPGVRILLFPLGSPPRVLRTILVKAPLCHFAAFLGNALLISHYTAGDARLTVRRDAPSVTGSF